MSGTNYIASNWRVPENSNSSKNDNYSLSFDGSTNYIDCGNISALANLTEATWAGWFKRSSFSTTYYLMSTWGVTGSTRQFYVSQTPTILEVGMALGGFGNTRVMYRNTSLTFTTDVWYHLAFVYNEAESDNADKLKFYINGVPQTNESPGNAIGYINPSTASFEIGKLGGYTTNEFAGDISDVCIFDYALTQDQVNTLHGDANSGAGNPMALKPTPVAYYPLGDNSSGDPVTQPNVSVDDASVFDFNGSTDYINTPQINLGLENTISFWAKSDGTNFNGMVLGGIVQSNYYTVFLNGVNNLLYRVGAAANSFTDADINSALGSGNWFHCALVRNNGGADVLCYINGDLKQTITGIVGSGNDTIVEKIGARTLNDFKIDGELSNIVIWNSDQSAEISNIYNDGIPATSYTNTPTAWWKLDQSANWDVGGSGNWTIPDASGNGNDGTSSGMTSGNLVLSDLTRNLPYENYSLDFDGALEYVDCGNISGLNGGLTEATWSGWFNRSSTGTFYLFSTYGAGQIQFFVLQGNNYVTAYAATSTGAQRTMAKANVTSWTTGQWYHFAFVYDEAEVLDSDKMKIYIDGVLQTNAVAGSSLTSLNSSTAPFNIGRLGGATTNEFNGNISNVAIWDTNLSSTEVQKLYANGTPQDLTNFTPQPINWWTLGKNSFWNGSSWIIRDVINSNDGTSANMGVDSLTGDAPRSENNGTATNMDIPTNLVGNAGFSDKNAYSINMSPSARVTDTP